MHFMVVFWAKVWISISQMRLVAAHNVGGIDRLVGGKLHEALNAVFRSRCQQVLGAENIVLDRLGRADLHQRNMLVGGGMENDRGMIGLKHLVQARACHGWSRSR